MVILRKSKLFSTKLNKKVENSLFNTQKINRSDGKTVEEVRPMLRDIIGKTDKVTGVVCLTSRPKNKFAANEVEEVREHIEKMPIQLEIPFSN